MERLDCRNHEEEFRSESVKHTIVHLNYGALDALPPLINEVYSIGPGDYSTTIVATDAGREESEGNVSSQYVRLVSLKQSVRKVAAGSHPGLKILRFAETFLRSMHYLVVQRPSLVIAHDLTALPAAWFYGYLFSKPVLYHAHELWLDHASRVLPLPEIWKAIERFFAPRVKRVILSNEYRSRIYYSELKLRRMPVTVRNYPPQRLLQQPAVNDQTTCSVNPGSRYSMIYQGLFDSSRCLLELVEALHLLPDNISCVLLGDGDAAFTDRLRNEIEALALSDRVRIIGRVPYSTVSKITSSADIGVLLYRNDSRNNYYCASNKLYEYLHTGLAVIASDFPGIRKSLEESDAGRCVLPFDPESIARAVMDLVSEPDILRAQRETRRLNARRSFMWEQEYPRLKKLYHQYMKPQSSIKTITYSSVTPV